MIRTFLWLAHGDRCLRNVCRYLAAIHRFTGYLCTLQTVDRFTLTERAFPCLKFSQPSRLDKWDPALAHRCTGRVRRVPQLLDHHCRLSNPIPAGLRFRLPFQVQKAGSSLAEHKKHTQVRAGNGELSGASLWPGQIFLPLWQRSRPAGHRKQPWLSRPPLSGPRASPRIVEDRLAREE
jgi:hypothetical protein